MADPLRPFGPRPLGPTGPLPHFADRFVGLSYVNSVVLRVLQILRMT